MMVIRNLTTREWVFGFLLNTYIGGFAFFWGASTNDPYLLIVFAFLVTQLVGNRFAVNTIFKQDYVYRVSNRYLRLLMNFGANIVIANILLFVIRLIHPGDMAEYLVGPFVYGILFGILYFIYFLLILKLMDSNSSEASIRELD